MSDQKLFTLKLTSDGLEVIKPNQNTKKTEPKEPEESDIKPARWSHWRQRKLARIWQATMLGFNIEPSVHGRAAMKAFRTDQHQE